MASLFRRNTTNAQSAKNVEDFADYAIFIATENDPGRLKDYCGRIFKSLKDKTRSLRNAYAKLDHLNSEILQEKTRFSDIQDENKSLRDQICDLADKLASREEEFKAWQQRLVESATEERILMEEEHEDECTRLDNRVLELEEALQIANEELGLLTSRIRELSDAASDTKTRRSSMDSRVSETTDVVSAIKQYDEERQQLSDQLLEVTQHRIELQAQLEILHDEQDELKRAYADSQEENARLRQENDQLRQQITRRAFMKSLEDVNLDD